MDGLWAHSCAVTRENVCEHRERTNQKREARRLLARMNRCEEFAGKWENFDAAYPDLPRWEAACQRNNFAGTYERLVGVVPTERFELRRRLEEIVEHGVGTVEECIAEINRKIQGNRFLASAVVSSLDSFSDDSFA